ncbi:MAG: Rrf2 family transcriptional regulator [Deltaproteobacteria bacterium]|nr:Rrf2 family transcriptional regulator [Deltaproteobacteria bacterium]
MKLGRESEYAIIGLITLAMKPHGTVMLLRDIAASGGVSQSFLAKIFQKLTRGGVVRSSRGAIRGYALARHPQEIKIREILLAIEGADLLDRCIFWSHRCGDANACPMHFRWKQLKDEIISELLEGTTLADLTKGKAA